MPIQVYQRILANSTLRNTSVLLNHTVVSTWLMLMSPCVFTVTHYWISVSNGISHAIPKRVLSTKQPPMITCNLSLTIHGKMFVSHSTPTLYLLSLTSFRHTTVGMVSYTHKVYVTCYICYFLCICVCTSYYRELVVGLRTVLHTVRGVGDLRIRTLTLDTKTSLYVEDRGLQVVMVLEYDHIPHTYKCFFRSHDLPDWSTLIFEWQ